MRILPLIGYHVVGGEPLASIRSDDGSPPPQATVNAAIREIVIVRERLAELDLGFDIRQLVDMANRSMGTTQNDAYTATQAVHHLTALLSDAARRSFVTRQLVDRRGTTRVSIPIMDFPTHLKVVCAHIRQGGSERHPRVTLELLRLLGSVAAAAVGEGRRSAIARELESVVAAARRSLPPGVDLEEMEATAAAARARLPAATLASGAGHTEV